MAGLLEFVIFVPVRDVAESSKFLEFQLAEFKSRILRCFEEIQRLMRLVVCRMRFVAF